MRLQIDRLVAIHSRNAQETCSSKVFQDLTFGWSPFEALGKEANSFHFASSRGINRYVGPVQKVSKDFMSVVIITTQVGVLPHPSAATKGKKPQRARFMKSAPRVASVTVKEMVWLLSSVDELGLNADVVVS